MVGCWAMKGTPLKRTVSFELTKYQHNQIMRLGRNRPPPCLLSLPEGDPPRPTTPPKSISDFNRLRRGNFILQAPLHLNSLHSRRDCLWATERGIDRQSDHGHGYISIRSGCRTTLGMRPRQNDRFFGHYGNAENLSSKTEKEKYEQHYDCRGAGVSRLRCRSQLATKPVVVGHPPLLGLAIHAGRLGQIDPSRQGDRVLHELESTRSAHDRNACRPR